MRCVIVVLLINQSQIRIILWLLSLVIYSIFCAHFLYASNNASGVAILSCLHLIRRLADEVFCWLPHTFAGGFRVFFWMWSCQQLVTGVAATTY